MSRGNVCDLSCVQALRQADTYAQHMKTDEMLLVNFLSAQTLAENLIFTASAHTKLVHVRFNTDLTCADVHFSATDCAHISLLRP